MLNKNMRSSYYLIVYIRHKIKFYIYINDAYEIMCHIFANLNATRYSSVLFTDSFYAWFDFESWILKFGSSFRL
jgi:hypothetical protein